MAFVYESTKTYQHNLGLSCSFRQWRASSHCKWLHGYALAFKFIFACSDLDDRNWCVDFGDLKELKQFLENNFDHKTVVSADDPNLAWFIEGKTLGTLDLIILEEGVGCELYAKYAFDKAKEIIEKKYGKRVRLKSCEVTEHGANSAIYSED